VARFAARPKLQDEPDIPSELAKALKGVMMPDDEPAYLSVSQRITPIDRWFGYDKQMIENRHPDDPFVDATDELNYVTLALDKPMGIEFQENPRGEGGGAMIAAVKPGGSAQASGRLAAGAHLIAVGSKPVHGLPFEEALQPIIEKEGQVTLTFFMGEAVYFYGEFRPSVVWLADFMERLKGQEEEDIDADDAQ